MVMWMYYGVFPLPDSDSYTNSYSDLIEMTNIIMCRNVSTEPILIPILIPILMQILNAG